MRRQPIYRIAASRNARQADFRRQHVPLSREYLRAHTKTATATVAVPEAVVVPVNPAPELTLDQILDGIASGWFSKYAILPNKAAETFLTLWAAHTFYRMDDGMLAFKVTPRAWLLSSTPQSAKSLVLVLLALVSYKVSGIEIEPTGPGLKLIISREKGTAMLDEGDILFGTGKRKEEVRAIINAGYSQIGFGGTVTNGMGGSPNRSKVFGPLALAALDVMETGTDDYLRAMLERGVKIRMKKATGRQVKALPNLEDDLVMGGAETDAETGREALEWVAGQTWDRVIGDKALAIEARNIMPDELDARAAQIWYPLARIALAVGGDWPQRVREAARVLSGGRGTTAPTNFTSAFNNRKAT